MLGICLASASTQRCDQNDLKSMPFSSTLLQVNAQKQPLEQQPEEDSVASQQLASTLMSAGVSNPQLSDGLVLVRLPKTGSTTLSFVVQGLAGREGLERLYNANDSMSLDNTSYVYSKHGYFAEVGGALHQLLPHAFRLSMVRDPVDRCMSAFYHLFERNHAGVGAYGDSEKIAVITGNCDSLTDGLSHTCANLACPGFQLGYLAPYSGASVNETFEQFDFLGVTDRYEESLVLLAKQLGRPLADVLYVKFKESGVSAECGGQTVSEVDKPPLEEESEAVQQAARQLKSDDDAELVAMANAALDEKIANYGASFQSDLALFRSWLAIAEDECRCLGLTSPERSITCVHDLAQARQWL